jgi:hypothetical protein
MALHCGTHQLYYLALHVRRTQMNKALSSVNNQWPVGSSSACYSCSIWGKTMIVATSTTETWKLANLVYLLRSLVKDASLTPWVFSLSNRSECVSFLTIYTATAYLSSNGVFQVMRMLFSTLQCRSTRAVMLTGVWTPGMGSWRKTQWT